MKTLVAIVILACGTQAFAGPHGHYRHHDWRSEVRQLSHKAQSSARDLSRDAHRHLERHPGDVNQLRALISARSFATAVQDLGHQLEYVRADPHCLELLVADVRQRGERVLNRVNGLADCHVRRDLVRRLECVNTSLCALTDALHRVNNPPQCDPPPRYGHHKSRGHQNGRQRQVRSNDFGEQLAAVLFGIQNRRF